MKTQSQIVMISLVTLFTMALSLAVALICISHLKEQDKPSPESTSDTRPIPSDFSVIQSEPDVSSEEPTETEPPRAQLRFSPNGDGTCALDGIGECKDAFIIVPTMSPDGDIVVEIADNAFKNCNKIKGIEFSETIKRIGAYAFYGSNVREITIPSTVREIGNYAFAGCKYLEAIEVDEDNSNFSSSSGILYSKDGSTLITYPAGKSENFVIISKNVTEISNMAFYKCNSIKKVTYHGTSASWKSVEIGAGNDVIEEAVIYCAGDGSK